VHPSLFSGVAAMHFQMLKAKNYLTKRLS